MGGGEPAISKSPFMLAFVITWRDRIEILDQRFVHDIAEICPRHLDVKVHVHRHGFLQWMRNGENPRAESSVTSVDHCHLRDIAALKVPQSRRTI